MQIARDDPAGALRLSGTLRINDAEELLAAMRGCVSAAPRPAIDLSAVDACDTAALQLLCSAARVFHLVGVPDAVRDAAADLGLSIGQGGPEDAM